MSCGVTMWTVLALVLGRPRPGSRNPGLLRNGPRPFRSGLEARFPAQVCPVPATCRRPA